MEAASLNPNQRDSRPERQHFRRAAAFTYTRHDMNKHVDPEIAAMQQVAASVADLDKETQQRIADWMMKRYGSAAASVAAGQRMSAAVTERRQGKTASVASGGTSEFSVFTELYDAATPETGSEKALVGGYWLQTCQGRESFASQEVNDLLKNQGHAVSNITVAFTKLRDAKPRLVHQLQKAGKTKQARKTMKLTEEGVRKVRAMTKGETD